eukprot:c17849_g1_i1 orf=340-2223(-)
MQIKRKKWLNNFGFLKGSLRVSVFFLIVEAIAPGLVTQIAMAYNGCLFNFNSVQNFTSLCYQDNGSGAPARTVICCEEIYGAVVFMMSQRANTTGEMCVSKPVAEDCISILERSLISGEHLRPSFFQKYCPLPASRITANVSSCKFSQLSELRRVIDLTNVSEACGHLQGGQKTGCQGCQTQLLQATSRLAGMTHDEPGACGTAIAVALTSSNPSLFYFETFYQCVLQILGGVPITEFLNISTSPDLPTSTGISEVHVSKTLRVSSRTLFIILGTFAGISVLAFLAIAVMYLFKNKTLSPDSSNTLSGLAVSGEILLSPESNEAIGLPTDGFYIFHLNELIKATNNFNDSLVVGKGSAGTVYTGQLPSGKLVAVKLILKENKVETFYKEVNLLARLRNPNLVALLGYCQTKFAHLLVYEFMSNGDLSQKLLDKSSIALTWDQRLRIAVDCAKGLTYLHECPEGPIIHRDIKPSNILLNDSLEAKLSDFGLSKILEMEASHVSTEIKGTTGYLDPEYLILGQLTEASDVYSFGVVLLQLISGRKAIDCDSKHNRSIVQLATSVMNHEVDFQELIDTRLEGVYSLPAFQKILAVAYCCVQARSYDRPSISEVLDGLEVALRLGKSHPPA